MSKHLSEGHKRKIGLANKGKGARPGHVVTLETRAKIGAANKRLGNCSKHPDRPADCRDMCASCYETWRRTNVPGVMDRHKERGRNRTPRQKRSAALKQRYGITAADYDNMFAEQGGVCKLCGTTAARLVVDHNHNTGAVRGLLCDNCNHFVGMLESTRIAVHAAQRYISDSG